MAAEPTERDGTAVISSTEQNIDTLNTAPNLITAAKESLPNIDTVIGVRKGNQRSVLEIASSAGAANVATFIYVDKQGEVQEIPTVFKRMETRKHLKNEIKTYQKLMQFPQIPQLQPIFSFDDGEDQFFATEAIPYLKSLESYWDSVLDSYMNARRSGSSDLAKKEEQLLKMYDFVSLRAWLAHMRIHQCGIMQKDPAPRNVSIHTQTGKEYLYDFEVAAIIHESSPLSRKKSVLELSTFTMVLYQAHRYDHDNFKPFLPDDIITKLKHREDQLVQHFENTYSNNMDLFSTYGWNDTKEQVILEAIKAFKYDPHAPGKKRLLQVFEYPDF
jgi:hypothetical protein